MVDEKTRKAAQTKALLERHEKILKAQQKLADSKALYKATMTKYGGIFTATANKAIKEAKDQKDAHARRHARLIAAELKVDDPDFSSSDSSDSDDSSDYSTDDEEEKRKQAKKDKEKAAEINPDAVYEASLKRATKKVAPIGAGKAYKTPEEINVRAKRAEARAKSEQMRLAAKAKKYDIDPSDDEIPYSARDKRLNKVTDVIGERLIKNPVDPLARTLLSKYTPASLGHPIPRPRYILLPLIGTVPHPILTKEVRVGSSEWLRASDETIACGQFKALDRFMARSAEIVERDAMCSVMRRGEPALGGVDNSTYNDVYDFCARWPDPKKRDACRRRAFKFIVSDLRKSVGDTVFLVGNESDALAGRAAPKTPPDVKNNGLIATIRVGGGAIDVNRLLSAWTDASIILSTINGVERRAYECRPPANSMFDWIPNEYFGYFEKAYDIAQYAFISPSVFSEYRLKLDKPAKPVSPGGAIPDPKGGRLEDANGNKFIPARSLDGTSFRVSSTLVRLDIPCEPKTHVAATAFTTTSSVGTAEVDSCKASLRHYILQKPESLTALLPLLNIILNAPVPSLAKGYREKLQTYSNYQVLVGGMVNLPTATRRSGDSDSDEEHHDALVHHRREIELAKKIAKGKTTKTIAQHNASLAGRAAAPVVGGKKQAMIRMYADCPAWVFARSLLTIFVGKAALGDTAESLLTKFHLNVFNEIIKDPNTGVTYKALDKIPIDGKDLLEKLFALEVQYVCFGKPSPNEKAASLEVVKPPVLAPIDVAPKDIASMDEAGKKLLLAALTERMK